MRVTVQDAFSLKKKKIDRKTKQTRILYRSLEHCSRSLHAPHTCPFSFAYSKAKQSVSEINVSLRLTPHQERPLNLFLPANRREGRKGRWDWKWFIPPNMYRLFPKIHECYLHGLFVEYWRT